jgi:hypothetical protein
MCDQPKPIFDGRNQKNTATLHVFSLQCDDKADIVIVVPDDKTQPIYAQVDMKRRGAPEGIVFDMKRTGKWSISYWDTQLDGTFPLKGLHPDGKLMPTAFEPRCGQKKPLADFKCG